MPSINDFRASFSADVARPSRFDVSIPIPLTLIPYLGTSRNLNMRCESAQLPAQSYATVEQKTYGPIEKHPHQVVFNDADLVFIVGDDMKEKLFFDAWINLINPSSNYDFKYKGDYVVDLIVNQYDVADNLSYSVTLRDAFPVSMNQLDLDWTNQDSHHKLAITFAYTSWQNNSIQALGMGLLESGLGGLADGLGGLGGTAADSGLGSAVGSIIG
jgi:hypothetical protein